MHGGNLNVSIKQRKRSNSLYDEESLGIQPMTWQLYVLVEKSFNERNYISKMLVIAFCWVVHKYGCFKLSVELSFYRWWKRFAQCGIFKFAPYYMLQPLQIFEEKNMLKTCVSNIVIASLFIRNVILSQHNLIVKQLAAIVGTVAFYMVLNLTVVITAL